MLEKSENKECEDDGWEAIIKQELSGPSVNAEASYFPNTGEYQNVLAHPYEYQPGDTH